MRQRLPNRRPSKVISLTMRAGSAKFRLLTHTGSRSTLWPLAPADLRVPPEVGPRLTSPETFGALVAAAPS